VRGFASARVQKFAVVVFYAAFKYAIIIILNLLISAKFSVVFFMGQTAVLLLNPVAFLVPHASSGRTLVHLFATQHCVKALLNVAPCNNCSAAIEFLLCHASLQIEKAIRAILVGSEHY